MGDPATSLPPPGVGKATLGETASQHAWLESLGPAEGIALSNFGSCRSRTQRRTQSFSSVHDQQKQANPLHRHIPPVSREKTWLPTFLFFVKGPSSPCTFPNKPQRQEDTLTPAQQLTAVPKHQHLRGQKALHTWKHTAQTWGSERGTAENSRRWTDNSSTLG